MPDGGRITLSTENVRDRVVVSVSDTGKGMTPQERDRAFEPFFTTKGSRGSGLGLSMVYAIVKRYGGEITLDSAPGVGTSVRLSFRATERPSEEEDVPEAETSVSRRILLIDDEADFVDIFSEILRSEGHHVEYATSPREGLAKVEAERFDLVSTDLGMPEMTGWGGRTKCEEDQSAHPGGPGDRLGSGARRGRNRPARRGLGLAKAGQKRRFPADRGGMRQTAQWRGERPVIRCGGPAPAGARPRRGEGGVGDAAPLWISGPFGGPPDRGAIGFDASRLIPGPELDPHGPGDSS